MSRLHFESSEALIFDAVAANRTSTRQALYTLGFRKIETVATLEAFVDAMYRRPPDLALCEAQGSGEQLCSIIQDLRSGSAGINPFVVIIVTAWEKTSGLVNRVVNSGADDLLLRPFSTTTLGQRIETHAERRKHFVVTTDYVGPDRRKNPSGTANAEQFNPPNSLKMKAKDRLPADEIAQRLDVELKGARDLLNAEKLKRDAFQISILWRLMESESSEAAVYKRELEKVGLLSRSVTHRCKEAKVPDSEELCNSIVAAVEGLETDGDRLACLKKLGEMSLSLNQLFIAEKSAEEILTDVDSFVKIIREREAMKKAAEIAAAKAAEAVLAAQATAHST